MSVTCVWEIRKKKIKEMFVLLKEKGNTASLANCIPIIDYIFNTHPRTIKLGPILGYFSLFCSIILSTLTSYLEAK